MEPRQRKYDNYLAPTPAGLAALQPQPMTRAAVADLVRRTREADERRIELGPKQFAADMRRRLVASRRNGAQPTRLTDAEVAAFRREANAGALRVGRTTIAEGDERPRPEIAGRVRETSAEWWLRG